MSPSRNIVVGAFVIGGILLFALGLFLIGSRRMLFNDSFHVYAEFAGISGLANGAKVRVGGMDAGEVVEVAVPPGPSRKFRVRARILEKLQPLVRRDSVATIQNDGIVGNKFLQVDRGSEQSPLAHDGATIQSREPFDFADLMQQLQETIGITNKTIVDVRGEVEQALKAITSTAEEAQTLIVDTGKDVKEIAAAGSKITENVRIILDGVRTGKGTVGKLFNDDKLYGQLRGATNDISETASNVRETSQDVRKMMADLRSRQVVDEVEKTVRNVRQVTDQLKTTLAGLQSKGDNPSLAQDLRQTLSAARETMADMADNTEALKRNWFFRGFFKKRGFYDLDSLTLAQYRQGDFARGRKTVRAWLPQSQLFSTGPENSQTLTQQGRERIDDEMARFVRYPLDSIIMVEGYAGGGSAADQYLLSRARATVVKDYIVKKYQYNPSYVGTMPMGAVASGGSGPNWDGVALVLFYSENGGVETAARPANGATSTNGAAPAQKTDNASSRAER